MICFVNDYLTDNFFALWAIMALASIASMMLIMSGPPFWFLYMRPTYTTWQHKTLAAYPKPEIVAKEIVQTCWGAVVSVTMPCFSVWLSLHGLNKGYCGFGTHGYAWEVGQFFIIWIASDFYEWFYHWCGHKFDELWKVHKFHHKFHNPTPFAVIADCAMDNV